jgi:cytochrome c556
MRGLLFGGTIAIALSVATTAALGADDPIDVRQKIMTSVGKSGGLLFGMVRGKTDFDERAASTALAALQAAAATIGDYFPDGSQTGEHTCAAAKIWEDRAGFDAVVAKFKERTSAAYSAAPKDVDALKAAVGPVFDLCGECHQTYRQSEDYSKRC